jgi:photosystem II stability/assembly factor-like uncharacterized protein
MRWLIAFVAAPVLVVAQSQTPYARISPVTSIDSTQLRTLQWRSIGPNRGGRSIAVAGSSSRPLEYYFGAVGGGLWKTTDGGVRWHPVTDGQIRSSSVGAVAVAESNPDVVYIGMGETCFRGNIMQGDGVYGTTNGGRTWQHLGLAETHAVSKIRVHPKNPDVVFVAAFGHPYGRNAERGVYKSTDGGKSWRRVLYRDDKTAAIDISMDPGNPEVLYAAMWEAYRTPWTMSSGGAGSGLFKSTDGGETWTEITRNSGLPAGVIGRIGVSVSPADPNRVYAIVENADGGVFRSDDAGATWRRTNDERKLRQRAFYYTHITADPQNKDRVYVENVSFWRSDDGGTTFPTAISGSHGDHHDLWIASNDNRRLAQANDGGGAVSVNAGQTWSAQTFPTAQLYHVATTVDFPYHVCGAQQDNSTLCLPSSGWENLRGARSGALGDWMYAVGGGESGYIAPDPKDPDIFFAGSQGALLTRYDRGNGQVRDVQVYPRFFSGEPASALPERWQWTYPIVFSPKNPRVLYTSSQHLWMTRDNGQTWSRISPDLTRADTSTLGLSGGPITHDMNGPEVYGTIFTVAPSPLDTGIIWTGSDDGLVYVTKNAGRTWSNVTPAGLPKFARISIIDASRHDPGTAYLAAKNYQNDDRAPYIYRTHDFGRSWTRITAGVRRDDYAHVVREDPARPGLLYAGTEHGIYVSWDDGTNWHSLSLNLPDTQVPDLVVEDHDLVIATHGRSMYVMDDIAPLRGFNATVVSTPVRAYRARPATRGVNDAVIQYSLARAADSVRVDVLDVTGKVVRTYVGRPSAPAADSAASASASRDTILEPTGCEPPRRRGAGAPPTTNAGLNRFTWDLRYPGATAFPCMVIWSAAPEIGPLAVPGTYQVRVTAFNASSPSQTATQSLSVRMDPRLEGVTVADLRRQFDLAIRIRGKVTLANDAVLRIRRMRSQLAERSRRDTTIAGAANALSAKLRGVEEDLYQVRNRSGQDPLNFPIKLNNRIAALGRSVQTGHARPTNAAYKVFDELSRELDVVLQRLATVERADLAELNRSLEVKGLPLVRAE